MKILLVDDNESSRISIKNFLYRLRHKVIDCSDAFQALTNYETGRFDLVLADIVMPGMSGIELLQAIKSNGNRVPVVLFTGYGTLDTAIQALRLGAVDYLLKPVCAEELDAVIERVSPAKSTGQDNSIPKKKGRQKERHTREEIFQSGIGVYSLKMREIISMALKFQTCRNIPVLIQGETGTGKELIARLIHGFDCDESMPFIDINCAAIPASLFESELFGYEPGAFTGGINKGQKGKFDLAAGGTLFLDEVGELPPDLQIKLLRVIQERNYYRVGGLNKVVLDARIICATNTDLEEAIKQGKFRKDLYYRLKVGSLIIPPLRERKEEIIPLSLRFLREFSRQKEKKFNSISKEAAKILLTHNWPGNVRELRNLIEMVVFLYDDWELKPLYLENLFPSRKTGCLYINVNEPLLNNTISSISKQLVNQVLAEHNGNKTAAARELGVSRRSLYRLLERL